MNENFDLKFLKQVQEEVPIIYRNCLDSSTNPEPVTDKEITDAVKSLNRGKAPNAFGQLEIKTFKSYSWFIVVKKILIQYELPDPDLLDNVLEKYAWKKRFHTAINKYWTERIVSQSKLYSSLKHLSKTYVIGKCHPAVRPYLHSVRDIYRIPVKNKVLTGTYILQTNRAKFNQNDVNPICQLCHICEETSQHFIIDCEALAEDRDPILNDFLSVLRSLLDIYPQAADY